MNTRNPAPSAHSEGESFPEEYFRFAPVQEPAQILQGTALSFSQDAWRRLRKNKAALGCLGVLGIILGLAFAAPLIAPHNPNEQHLTLANLPPKIPGITLNGLNGYTQIRKTWVDRYAQAGVPEGTYFIFGTDDFGRDLLSRALYGSRISLTIAFIAAFLDLTIGVIFGLYSALKGGGTDTLLQRLLELLNGIPNLVLVVLLLLVFQPGITSIIFALVISSWIPMARLVRAQTLKVKNLEYVLAAQALGASVPRIAFTHILPNIAGLIIVRTMFSIPGAIFFETFLSFIGVGMKIPNASIGTLLGSGYKVFRLHPYQMWIPAIILCIIMVSFNLFADGLRDAFDPKMKD